MLAKELKEQKEKNIQQEDEMAGIQLKLQEKEEAYQKLEDELAADNLKFVEQKERSEKLTNEITTARQKLHEEKQIVAKINRENQKLRDEAEQQKMQKFREQETLNIQLKSKSEDLNRLARDNHDIKKRMDDSLEALSKTEIDLANTQSALRGSEKTCQNLRHELDV